MSNKYIEQGVNKKALLKKLARCSEGKKALIKEALAALEETPEPVVEAAPVVEVAEVVAEEPAPEVKPKPKRTYRRRKTTKTKE